MTTTFTPLAIRSDGFWIVKKHLQAMDRNTEILVVDIIGP